PVVKWTFPTGFSDRRLVVADGVVYTCAADTGTLYALDGRDGHQLWEYVAASPAAAIEPCRLAVADGNVFFTLRDEHLRAIDTTSGSLRWSHRAVQRVGVIGLATLFPFPPAVVGETVYLADDAGRVYALDSATGDRRWEQPILGTAFLPIAVAYGIIAVAATNPMNGDFNRLLALNAADGATIWESVFVPEFNTPPAIGNGLVVVGRGTAGLYAHEAISGELRWTHASPDRAAFFGSIAIAHGFVVAARNDGSIVAIDAMSGGLVWTHPAPAGAVGTGDQIVIAEGVVYSLRGGEVWGMSAHDAASGAVLWEAASESVEPIASYAVVDGLIFAIGGRGELVYALGAGELEIEPIDHATLASRLATTAFPDDLLPDRLRPATVAKVFDGQESVPGSREIQVTFAPGGGNVLLRIIVLPSTMTIAELIEATLAQLSLDESVSSSAEEPVPASLPAGSRLVIQTLPGESYAICLVPMDTVLLVVQVFAAGAPENARDVAIDVALAGVRHVKVASTEG
ncbi:MAG: PQQ-like beta-propeller repeat protein, partial [Thermomicrobiales bacterium]|nr:PQQ-like beta-propeller repeat protein [Thermomicrobiales bacterium]